LGSGGGAYSDVNSIIQITSSLVAGNKALGGSGGSGGPTGVGGPGGAGYGGGVYVSSPPGFGSPLPGGTLDLTDTLVTLNLAQGGDGGQGPTAGDTGQGIGGGLYVAPGGGQTLTHSRIKGNHASTSNDNIFD
jgi:hypothetical protein